MKMNTIARIVAAVILTLCAVTGTASASASEDPNVFLPPYVSPC